nr:hypothetical protein [Tanacetum cinerariifolium]
MMLRLVFPPWRGVKSETTDVRMDDSSRHNNDNGNSKHFKDEIDLVQLRNNIYKLMEEDKVFDINTDIGKDGVVGTKTLEVFGSDLRSERGFNYGGFTIEEDNLDCYDGYEAQIYDLPEQMHASCDHFDIRLNSRVRKLLLSISLFVIRMACHSYVVVWLGKKIIKTHNVMTGLLELKEALEDEI